MSAPRLFRQFVSILGLVDRKTSFLELWADENKAICPTSSSSRLVVLPVDADIIVYLLVFGDHISAVPSLTQSLAEALATPCCILRECAERGYEFEKLLGRLKRYVH